MKQKDGVMKVGALILASALGCAPVAKAAEELRGYPDAHRPTMQQGAYADSDGIPVPRPVPFSSYSPLALKVPHRPVPLELKISAPTAGTGLPVVLLSHGHGETNFLSSLRGYGPLADFWAAHGFIVIQPTHLDSKVLNLRGTKLEDAPLFWRSRATDMKFILDHLDEIEDAVPGLKGRMDRTRIAVAGHSLGGHTVTLLMGMQVLDPEDAREKDLSDKRIKAGVAIAAPGLGRHLNPDRPPMPPSLRNIDFSKMSGTTLVVAGDADVDERFSKLASYRWDAYTYSPPGNKTLLKFRDAKHMFGGIIGYDSIETTDENPQRVAALRALTWAYMWSQLYPGDPAWIVARNALAEAPVPMATVETR